MLLPEHEGLPSGIVSAVEGIGSFFGATGEFFGALDNWFQVGLFLSVAIAGLTVEVVIAFVRSLRVVKQLLPFQ